MATSMGLSNFPLSPMLRVCEPVFARFTQAAAGPHALPSLLPLGSEDTLSCLPLTKLLGPVNHPTARGEGRRGQGE